MNFGCNQLPTGKGADGLGEASGVGVIFLRGGLELLGSFREAVFGHSAHGYSAEENWLVE